MNIVSTTFEFNGVYYKYANKIWFVLMYGSFMNQTSPGLIYRYVEIDENKVPKEIRNKV